MGGVGGMSCTDVPRWRERRGVETLRLRGPRGDECEDTSDCAGWTVDNLSRCLGWAFELVCEWGVMH